MICNHTGMGEEELGFDALGEAGALQPRDVGAFKR